MRDGACRDRCAWPSYGGIEYSQALPSPSKPGSASRFVSSGGAGAGRAASSVSEASSNITWPGAEQAAAHEDHVRAGRHEHAHLAPHPVGLGLGEVLALPAQVEQRIVQLVDAEALRGDVARDAPDLRHLADGVAVGLQQDVGAALRAPLLRVHTEKHQVLAPRLRADEHGLAPVVPERERAC